MELNALDVTSEKRGMSNTSPTRRTLLLAAASGLSLATMTALAGPASAADAQVSATIDGVPLGSAVLERKLHNVQLVSTMPLPWVNTYTPQGYGAGRTATAKSKDGLFRTAVPLDLTKAPARVQATVQWGTPRGIKRLSFSVNTRAVAALAPFGTPVTNWGAVGDGKADDTSALQKAFDSAPTGTTLLLPAGMTFRHSGILRITREGLTLAGGGKLLATSEATSSLLVTGKRTTLSDVTVAVTGTTKRWGTWDQMAVCVLNADAFTARGLKVEGSAAAGVYLWGATNFTLDKVAVSGTRADGIHITGPSRDGVVTDPVVTQSGDDGVAVVSYGQDGVPVTRVRIDRPRVAGTSWGRGVSVVGGTDITVNDLNVDSSSAAALFIAQEGAPWNTFAPVRVSVTGGTITRANQTASVDHGAVMVLAGRSGAGPTDVTVSGIKISGTRASASRQVGLLTYDGSQPARVQLTDFTIEGGPRNVLQSQYSQGSWRVKNWKVTGANPVPDQGGW